MDIKYPYVDSIQPVRNPYVIRYGDNLAPTLFEGSVESSTKVLSEYSAIVKATGSTIVEYRSELIPAIPNTKYTLRAKITLNGLEKYDGVYVDVLGYDESGLYVLDTPGTSVSGTGTGTDIFATPANIKTMEVRIVAPQDAAVGDYVIEDITLNLGTTAKTHKAREDCIFALQTDLYSDPVTGVNADEVFEKNGQYFRLAKWNRKVLDGSINWVGSFPFTGFKSVRYPLTNVVVRSAIGVKYDGKILNEYGGTDAPDKVTVDNDNAYVWISNADSGWGDNYTPTADEIKAYFMGWVLYNGEAVGDNPTTKGPYNGTGTKWWVRRTSSRGWADATNICPTTIAAEYTPYQLVYRLATPTVEPIVSEGKLTFNEGENQVEVGTGIVVRESVKPFQNPSNGNTVINSTSPGQESSKVKYSVERFLTVYKSSLPDNSVWEHNINDPYAFGRDRLFMTGGINYAPLATYSVTYLMLDKSPIVPFTGSYAANEKAMLQELTDSVQQNATAVSVLMNKKVDKDAPGWISPTLLNGWVNRNTGFDAPLSYRKIEGLGVQVRGIIQLGTTGVVFSLPNGYRPERTHFDIVMGYIQSQASYIFPYITITPAGEIRIDAVSTPPSWLFIDTIIPI